MKKAIIFIAWVVVTTVCNSLLIYFFIQSEFSFTPLYVGGLVFGLLLGICQWLIISKIGRVSSLFVPITCIAWAFCYSATLFIWVAALYGGFTGSFEELGDLLQFLGVNLFVGAVFGLCQWFFLRRKFLYAGWWILASAVGWAIGLAILITINSVDNLPNYLWLGYLVFYGMLGALMGIPTGITLILLPVRQTEIEIPYQTPVASLNRYLNMLKSPKASVRYDACEELRVATISNPEVILALEEATHDKDKGVVEVARAALGAEVHQQMSVKMGRSSPVTELESDVKQDSEQPAHQNDVN